MIPVVTHGSRILPEDKATSGKTYKPEDDLSLELLKQVAVAVFPQLQTVISLYIPSVAVPQSQFRLFLLKECMGKLGTDVYDWEHQLANKEMYDNEKLGRKVFLSLKPLLSKSTLWLRSNHIRDVLSREEQKNPSFKAYGPFEAGYLLKPSDVPDCVLKYAFVLNTSPHFSCFQTLVPATTSSSVQGDRGSHWVVCFVDVKTNIVEYFDALGQPPSPFMIKTLQSIINVLHTVVPSCSRLTSNILWTSKRKQTTSNACAIYVVHYVCQRLSGKTLVEFDNEPMTDQQMYSYRSVYWHETDKDIF